MFNRASTRPDSAQAPFLGSRPVVLFSSPAKRTFVCSGVVAVKTIPGAPRSHAFIAGLIGSIRREYLDRIWFWHQSDLERKSEDYKSFLQ
jgi:hypothetical protein